ncbi:hypothetical protein T11_4596 [Trichinella zimbabwensis]|uniref:Uncharacterized protein n=1 Tax=Trichinella zimbabwensis TaxID=268475 RepID=A0A0V1GQI0_9BILA|nr:hypothetical protein T11_4596 [Trichinella zimbabwensis]
MDKFFLFAPSGGGCGCGNCFSSALISFNCKSLKNLVQVSTILSQQTGQRKWGDNGNSVGLQSDFACFLKVHFANVISPTPTSTSPADSVVQFQRCLLLCDKLKRSGLLYKRSAHFVCHQQLLCQLSPIDKVAGSYSKSLFELFLFANSRYKGMNDCRRMNLQIVCCLRRIVKFEPVET